MKLQGAATPKQRAALRWEMRDKPRILATWNWMESFGFVQSTAGRFLCPPKLEGTATSRETGAWLDRAPAGR
jgi:hypothetical protein